MGSKPFSVLTCAVAAAPLEVIARMVADRPMQLDGVVLKPAPRPTRCRPQCFNPEVISRKPERERAREKTAVQRRPRFAREVAASTQSPSRRSGTWWSRAGPPRG